MGYSGVISLIIYLVAVDGFRIFNHAAISYLRIDYIGRSHHVQVPRPAASKHHLWSVEDTQILSIIPDKNQTLWQVARQDAQIMYRFSRPHTIRGTVLASTMAVARALMDNSLRYHEKIIGNSILGLLALLCGNAYIVGINQIFDVNIDKINKPFLPIASDALTVEAAWKICIAALSLGSFIVQCNFSPVIRWLYHLGILLGTLYSVPPFQWKRYPLLACGIISIVRGFLLNFGVYYAVRETLSVPFKWNPVVLFISCFMTAFASVIAITKDLSDVEGDNHYQISTFATKFGVKNTAVGASVMLSSMFVAAMLLPLVLPNIFNAVPMVIGHGASLIYIWKSIGQFDDTNPTSVRRFYKAVWNLFYFEYMLYPFI